MASRRLDRWTGVLGIALISLLLVGPSAAVEQQFEGAAAEGTVDVAGADIEVVSVASDGGTANGASELADLGREAWGRAISASGRYVLFRSDASDLVDDDSDDTTDVFVRDRSTSSTQLVAASSGGSLPQLSSDGGALVFQTAQSEELEPGSPCSDAEAFTGIFLEDLGGGDVTPVTPRSRDQDGYCWGSGLLPAISGDGGTVAFISTDRWHIGQPGDASGAESLFAYDVGSGSYDLLVQPPESDGQVLPALDLQVDQTGGTVLFTARGPYHQDTPADDGLYTYVHHRATGQTSLASRDDSGTPVPVTAADLSADGRWIAFVNASDAGDRQARIYLFDVETGTSTLVSVGSDGAPLSGWASTGSVAVDGGGTLVAFVWSDQQGSRLLVRDVASEVTWQIDGPVVAGDFDLSDDGNVLAFESGREVEAAVFCLPAETGTRTTSSRRRLQQQSTCPAGTPELIALEVTQGIQNLDHDVELIQGRRTWVRAHVRSTRGTLQDVPARLRVYRSLPSEGLLGVLPPLDLVDLDASFNPQPSGTVDLVSAPARTDTNSHYYFELPDDWTSGILALEFEGIDRDFTCSDRGSDCSAPAFFAASADPTVDVQLAPIVWTDENGVEHEPDAAMLAQTAQQFRAALPIASLQVATGSEWVFFADEDPALDADLRDVLNDELEAYRGEYGCHERLSDACYLVGVFVSETRATDSSVDGSTPSSLFSDGADVFIGRGDRQLELVLAHELGHAAGLEHVDSSGAGMVCSGEPSPYDPYPFARGQLGTSLVLQNQTGYEPATSPQTTFWGTDVFRFLHRTGRILAADSAHDLMTYCTTVWTSHTTWGRIRDRFNVRFAAPGSGTRAAASGTADLVVDGTLRDGAGTIDRVRGSDGRTFGTVADSDLELRLADAAGTEVDRIALAEWYVRETGETRFEAGIPVGDDVRRLELLLDGSVIDRVEASATPPTVSLSAPTPGASGDTVQVRWSAQDGDGDPLRTRVEYSPDDGTTWRPAGVNVSGTSFTLDTTGLPGSSTARVRVRVSDGFWTGDVVSERFTLSDSPPQVEISLPEDVTYLPGQTVPLAAYVQDLEDGPLDGDDVVWASDRDGRLGTGAALPVPVERLSLGTHRITVTATDAAGQAATASATIEIGSLAATVRRLSGSSRIETAVAVSRADFAGDGSAGAVVLSRADLFADALAGTPLALAKDAPLLLTTSHTLSPAAQSEIVRVLPAGGTVYLLGGTAALSSEVEAQLADLGFQTVRLGGRNRYETAAAIASEGFNEPEVLLLADGVGFPDALAAGAAAGAMGGAVLLTENERLPDATRGFLEAHAGVPQYAVGGPAARAAPAATAIVGASRYETAAAVAEQLLPAAIVVGLADGTNFPDALAGGAHAGRLGGPVLLTPPSGLPDRVEEELVARAGRVAAAYVYGGMAALPEAIANAVQRALS